ncbi:DUF5667 domain-containing protein [Saccharothrix violaceirubra]|uniref:DUF5667 domain-containing protein n=1 Tax=Saccharothrix violaceirubra TaxID=413306 RepID=A0A7W7WTJ1_9PSEU|nr:DUF5667 domain-containing protein [Saccharothrix violaceirubra]MBB4962762.1 hypothetical protein [Saccharothrix violaceirubra]
MVGRGITPLGRRRERERFARAVDAQPGEVDPGSPFAAELAVVAGLRDSAALAAALDPTTPGPDEAARSRMRARILTGLTTPDLTTPDAGSPSSGSTPAGGNPPDTDAISEPAPRGDAPGTAVQAAADPMVTNPTAAGNDTRHPTPVPRPRTHSADPTGLRDSDPTAPQGNREPTPPPPTRLDRRRSRAGTRGRIAVAAAAGLLLVLSLAGTSLLLSRDALPGDALYGFKRTAESASLGLTFDEEDKGYKRLEFATARVDELTTLTDRNPDGGGPLGGYLTALTDFDSDAAAGARSLAATTDPSTLTALTEWANAQADRLARLRPDLPAEAGSRADASLDLLGRIARRAADLATRVGCAVITSGGVDEVGPLPAAEACTPGTRQNPTTPGQPAPTTPGGAVTATTPGGTAAPPAGTVTGGPGVPSAQLPVPPATTVPTTSGLPLTLPLPLPLPGLSG